MVRLGIGLYGYQPCPETTPLIELRPAMSVHARITDTRLVPMSEGVSYGLNYRSPGSVKICTVPVGYGDGLRRGLSSRTDFLVDGVRCRQVGNICMDQSMFEVNLRSYARRRRVDPQVGDEVLIVGQQGDAMVTIEEMCETLGTIPHELCIGRPAHAALLRVGRGAAPERLRCRCSGLRGLRPGVIPASRARAQTPYFGCQSWYLVTLLK